MYSPIHFCKSLIIIIHYFAISDDFVLIQDESVITIHQFRILVIRFVAKVKKMISTMFFNLNLRIVMKASPKIL